MVRNYSLISENGYKLRNNIEL